MEPQGLGWQKHPKVKRATINIEDSIAILRMGMGLSNGAAEALSKKREAEHRGSMFKLLGA